MSGFQPYIHCVILAFLLRFLELRYGEAVPGFDPVFRCVPGIPYDNPSNSTLQGGLGAAQPGSRMAKHDMSENVFQHVDKASIFFFYVLERIKIVI